MEVLSPMGGQYGASSCSADSPSPSRLGQGSLSSGRGSAAGFVQIPRHRGLPCPQLVFQGGHCPQETCTPQYWPMPGDRIGGGVTPPTHTNTTKHAGPHPEHLPWYRTRVKGDAVTGRERDRSSRPVHTPASGSGVVRQLSSKFLPRCSWPSAFPLSRRSFCSSIMFRLVKPHST